MKKLIILATTLALFSASARAEDAKPPEVVKPTYEQLRLQVASDKIEIATMKLELIQLQANQAYAAAQKELTDAQTEATAAKKRLQP